jgi:D-glycero-D-manno-heptose 1,7-bisphosphate phosphatase
MISKLVILDRDGVINHDSDEFIKNVDEWLPIDGSLEAIARLNHEGYTVVVASNQSGLARGMFDIEALTAIHKKMDDLLENTVAGSMPYFIVHMALMTVVPAVNRSPACCWKSASVSTFH